MYTINQVPWWVFWDRAVYGEGFIVKPDGQYIDKD